MLGMRSACTHHLSCFWHRKMALFIWFVLCSSAHALDASAPLFSAVNPKYGLSADFFGEWVGPDGDEKSQYLINRVSLRKIASGERVEYQLADPTALRTSLGFYRAVWSPDGEYIALPLGRFEGFRICDARTVLEKFAKRQSSDSIMIRYKQLPQSVWHSFAGWSGDHVLLFDADIEKSKIRFAYDLKLKRLSSTVAPIAVLDAVNSAGLAEIAWGR